MYIRRLIIVAIATCVISFLTGWVFDYQFKKRWSVIFFEKSDELIKGHNNYDIIFLGNSRVHFGINPYYVDSVTKLNSYNFGTGGADAQDIRLSSLVYLQHHKPPKLVIISLDKASLGKKDILKTRFHYLFYLENDTISKYMKLAGFPTPLIKALPFIKYSFFDEYNRTSIFVKGTPFPVFAHNIYKGFMNPHQYTRSKAADNLYNINAGSNNLWEPSIIYLRNTIAALQQAGSTVVFISPPEKNHSLNRESTLKHNTDSIINIIAQAYHIRYFHFEKTFDDREEYFVDDIHLNEPGTKIYSIQLADSIKNIYPYLKKASY